MTVQRVLGIDPGSLITGWGIIDFENSKIKHIDHGSIFTKKKEFFLRLKEIYLGITEVIAIHQPMVVSIEQVFVSKNPQSALKLGQARGVALIAALNANLDIHEYAPTKIKQAVTGRGRADKQQVTFMVQTMLQLSEPAQVDASDALAAAICYVLQPKLPEIIQELAQKKRSPRFSKKKTYR